MDNKQYLVSHRGAAGLAPENTLKAFKIGLDTSADVVECDIHLTKDNQLVVFHDNTLDRTSNGSGWIHEFTLEELQKLDAGDGEIIPSLKQILELVLSTSKKLIIEIKGPSVEEVIKITENLNVFLSSYPNISERVYIHSFWLEAIRRFKDLNNGIRTHLVVMLGLPIDELIRLIKLANADGLAIAYDYVNKELVNRLHTENLFIDTWLLNDSFVFDKMRDLRVDGLITNYPDRMHL